MNNPKVVLIGVAIVAIVSVIGLPVTIGIGCSLYLFETVGSTVESEIANAGAEILSDVAENQQQEFENTGDVSQKKASELSRLFSTTFKTASGLGSIIGAISLMLAGKRFLSRV